MNINPPDGSVHPDGQNIDIHNYLLWVTTSDRGLSNVLARRGFPAYYVPGARHTFTPGVALRHGLLDVPWATSAYRIASAESAVAVPPHSHRVFWLVDKGARTRQVVVQMAVSTENLADCGITTQPGTRLARLLGSSETTSPCFLQSETSAPVQF